MFVLQATIAFWTIEGLEVANIFTYGGVETAQFPLTIYSKWFRRFFTFIVPLACVNYLPALAILGRGESLGFPQWVSWLSPALGVVFLCLTLQVWRFGVRHYCSTGS
jgi:ABC-2 type transport system permease protein